MVFTKKQKMGLKPSFINILRCLAVFDTLFLVGWFLFRKFYFFNFYMVSSCSIWSPIFKTAFVFDVRPFLLLSVKFEPFPAFFCEISLPDEIFTVFLWKPLLWVCIVSLSSWWDFCSFFVWDPFTWWDFVSFFWWDPFLWVCIFSLSSKWAFQLFLVRSLPGEIFTFLSFFMKTISLGVNIFSLFLVRSLFLVIFFTFFLVSFCFGVFLWDILLLSF